MAQMPIEVVDVGSVSPDSLGQAISLANSIQSEFVYLSLPKGEAGGLRVLYWRIGALRLGSKQP